MVQLPDCDFGLRFIEFFETRFQRGWKKDPGAGRKGKTKEKGGRSKFCSTIFPEGKSLYAMRIEIVQL